MVIGLMVLCINWNVFTRGFGFVTFTDPVVAQKVVNMRDHTIQKSNLNVSFADPRGGAGKPAPPFTVDPFLQMAGYSPALTRHPGGVATARYPFPGQPQQQPQQQQYAMSYGAPQHMAVMQRADTPNALVTQPVKFQTCF